MQLTIKKVNEALSRRGVSEKLAKGKGYFYFFGGNASRWKKTCVYVDKINALSLERWMVEHSSLKLENDFSE